MIKLVEEKNLELLKETLAKADPLHRSIITTILNSVGLLENRLAEFWLVYGQGVEGLICRHSGAFYLAGENFSGRALSDIGSFLDAYVCHCLCCTYESYKKLGGRVKFSNVIHNKLLIAPDCEGKKSRRVVRLVENYRPVYILIRDNYGGHAVENGYNNWLAALRLRERDGVCALYAIYEGDEPVATATFSGVSEEHADIGSIVVRADKRGQGLGGEMVAHMQWLARSKGLIPMLCAAEDGLDDYYARFGFKEQGEWACGWE